MSRIRAGLVGCLLLLVTPGCSGTPVGPAASPSPAPGGRVPTSAPTPKPTASATPSIPADGVTLTTLGFTHGPLQTFSVPQPAYLTASSDQAVLVTLVLAAPTPAQVYDYLLRSLPAAGYTVTGRAPGGASTGPGSTSTTATPALSFTGHGWTGDFTGAGTTSVITLRPGS